MKAIPLTVTERTKTGKGVARKLRAAGRVPGVMYGESTRPQALDLVERELTAILRKSTSEQIIVDLTVGNGGSEPQMALLRDIQHDPLTGDILHVDFLHISATKPIVVTVPVNIIGVPTGVKDRGGILQHVFRELEVESLPADIPDKIDVDVNHLDVGDAIHVSDLDMPQVTFVTAPERTIVSVVPPTVMREPTEVEGEEGEAEGEAAEGAEGEGAEGADEGEASEEKKEE
ncbi:MAG: 50S ribosomal protein L25 [candidate division Zixibacteria bacterium]|nr:50S ribosomal protein L25 [candidate division Zixibacteria bacterium]